MSLLKQSLVATLVVVAGSPSAFAQAYPDKVVKMVVPFPAGSTVDALARFTAEELRTKLTELKVEVQRMEAAASAAAPQPAPAEAAQSGADAATPAAAPQPAPAEAAQSGAD